MAKITAPNQMTQIICRTTCNGLLFFTALFAADITHSWSPPAGHNQAQNNLPMNTDDKNSMENTMKLPDMIPAAESKIIMTGEMKIKVTGMSRKDIVIISLRKCTFLMGAPTFRNLK